MKTKINGVNYYYRWILPYQEAQPTLVCLHGFTGTSQTFSAVFPNEWGWNILGIDLIGHGQTDSYVHPYRYQLSTLCKDIALLIEKLDVPHFSLLGYSMGARVALGFTCLFPEKVDRLILESGSPGLAGKEERKLRQTSDERLARYIISHPLDSFVEKWTELPMFETQKKMSEQQQKKIRQDRLGQNRFGLACSLWFLGTGVQPSLWMELKKIKAIPTLLLVGKLDEKFKKIANRMKKSEPSLIMEVIQDAGHCIHVEQPEVFRKCVIEFVKAG